ncbi:sirohydrochlorin chelatase [Pedococcus sp. 5OH_020]|uniref:sirohydrochlorin chelatase n=1 Tax=Pedococcus sp. 5OH_020 TaxID=2989814 RepID=UPI0022E9C80B|nr:CbiX/SirB N-terminal domain-containing protein [Pedococcus sp. 5OH_020]
MSSDPDIVLLAHGSPDPRHARGVQALAGRVQSLVPHRPVHTAYLDHHAPSPTETAAVLGDRAVVVPVLLTPAFHAKVDVPEAVGVMLRRSGAEVALAASLGPHELLLDGVDELLAAAGLAPNRHTAVVLYAAGSSDSEAVATVARTVAQHPRQGWGAWGVAALDGGATLDQVLRTLPDEVERTVAVSFMVAEGVLRDRMAQECGRAGVRMVPGALAHTEAVARLVLRRADSVPA